MKAVAKIRKVNIGGDSVNDISGMFNGILNGEKVPLEIVWPRYLLMKKTVEELLDTVQQLHDCALMQRMKETKNSIAEYLEWGRKQHATHFGADLHSYTSDFSLIEDEIHTQFDKTYRDMKESQFIRQIIKSLEQLIVYRHDFNRDNVSMKDRLGFILQMPTATFEPFPFQFDLKGVMMMQGIGKNTHSFLVNFLTRYYNAALDLWNKSQEPDIDVEKFTDVISTSIAKLRTLPELHRCTTAFAKINSSIGMFKDNFANYYHNFIDTKDSTSIMHEFIMDVSNSTDTNPKLTMEFRTIINYYRKMADQQKNMDPDAKKLFSTVDDAFKKSEQNVDGDAIRKATREDIVNEHKGKAAKAKKGATTVSTASVAAANTNADEDIDKLVSRINGAGSSSSKSSQRGGKK